ncbi:MAG: amidohydrolase family protein [Sphingomonadales bacterium]|nr:amidohydrolase family protein [Sphingomonadales bacterium]MDE2167856.1 amidohydrolase family protein [Sphingomonadales bacterium]
MSTLFHNIRIFDGSASAPKLGSVLVDGNTIRQVAYAPDTIAAKADTLIDGAGKTLMPGMIEAHTHLTWASSVEKVYHQFILPPEELEIAATRNARVLLDHGFTSCYSAGALGDGIEARLHKAIEAGDTPGPRLIPSTLERSPEGGEGVDTGDVFNGRGPDAMRAFVKYCADQGLGSIKLVISGESALKPGSHAEVLYTPEEMDAAREATREHGLFIACHAYTDAAVDLALRAGARIIYHGSYISDAMVETLAAHKDELFYGPGCGVSVAALEASPPPHVDMSSMKSSAAERMDLERVLVPKLKARGLRILIGGDYGFPFNPNGRNARDLAHFVDYFGYTPLEALEAATGFGGELMDLPVGRVKEGYLADLLLVDGDPTQDVTILQDKSRLAAIMKDGVFHKAPAEAALT